MTVSPRTLERVRHTLKFRLGKVTACERLTPHMMRITLWSDDLSDFSSLAYDDHCKLFLAQPGQPDLPEPQITENGLAFPEGQRPPARDYTPRYFDTAEKTVTFDFVLHGDGPASSWAQQAKPGDAIGVGGPRGSFVLHGEFDWYLLVGDETALPAIGRRLEELPRDARAFAVIEVPENADIQEINAPAGSEIVWLARNGRPAGQAGPLCDAVAGMNLPQGDGYVFVAGENTMSKAVRTHMVDARGHNPNWIKAAGYWQKGDSDFDDGHAH